MNRREFIKTLNALSLLTMAGSIPGLSLFPALARAENTGDRKSRFFVMIRASTGWDVTLGLDPQIHSGGSDQKDMFIEYTPDQILSAGGIRFAPACAPLVPYADSLSVINGVFMSDSNVSHDANLDYISTANSEGGAADLPVEIAYACAKDEMFGVVFNQHLKRGNRMLIPNSVDNLLSLKNSINLTGFQSLLRRDHSRGSFHKSQIGLIHGAKERQKFSAILDTLKDEINPSNGGSSATTGKGAAVMAAAFLCGGAEQGLLDITESLDTHQDHPKNHLQSQTKVWEAVADVFRVFKKVPYYDSKGQQDGSMFDHTTFMVVSEFSRTPFLNPAQGKDHNPLTNSVLLAGGGVTPGLTVGQSRLITRHQTTDGIARHCAGLINYTNGRVAQTAQEAQAADFNFIFPENVAATVIDILGVDRDRIGSFPSSVASLPLLIA